MHNNYYIFNVMYYMPQKRWHNTWLS